MSKSFPTSLRSIEIVQKEEYGFTEENIKKFIDSMPCIDRYAYIKHGRSVLNEDNLPIEDIDTHFHLDVWFKSPVPTQNIINKLNSIGVKCELQQLEKIKKDDSAVAYLTHENVDKPTYPRENLVANFETDDIINKEVVKKSIRRNSDRLIDILNNIDNGIIKEYNLHNYISIVEYNTYKRDIDNAFNFRANRLRNEVTRSMECIFISGDSGVGKSTFAKKMASDRNLDIFVSSSSNDVLDGYGGQPCIILDDLRPSALGLADLLKLLDNNTSSSVKSRYRNKVLECQLIIITSTLTIDNFFKNVFTEQPETIIQLKRRCNLYIVMSKTSIKTYLYSQVKRDYNLVGELDNFVLLQFKSLEELKKEEQMDIVKRMIGSAGDMLKSVSENLEDFMPVDDNDNVFKLLDN